MFCSDSYSLGPRIFSCFFLFESTGPFVDCQNSCCQNILALMEERVTRPVTSSGNVSSVNAVRMLRGNTVRNTGKNAKHQTCQDCGGR